MSGWQVTSRTDTFTWWADGRVTIESHEQPKGVMPVTPVDPTQPDVLPRPGA